MVNNKQRAEVAKQLASKLPFSIKQVYNTLEQADLLSVDWESLDLINYPERWHNLVHTCLAVSATRLNPNITPASDIAVAWGKLITGQDPDLPVEPATTTEKLLEVHELNVRVQEAMTARINAISQEVMDLKQSKAAETPHLLFRVEYRIQGDTSLDPRVFEVSGMVGLLQDIYRLCDRNRGREIKFEAYYGNRRVTTFLYNGGGSLHELDANGKRVRKLIVWQSRSEL